MAIKYLLLAFLAVIASGCIIYTSNGAYDCV